VRILRHWLAGALGQPASGPWCARRFSRILRDRPADISADHSAHVALADLGLLPHPEVHNLKLGVVLITRRLRPAGAGVGLTANRILSGFPPIRSEAGAGQQGGARPSSPPPW